MILIFIYLLYLFIIYLFHIFLGIWKCYGFYVQTRSDLLMVPGVREGRWGHSWLWPLETLFLHSAPWTWSFQPFKTPALFTVASWNMLSPMRRLIIRRFLCEVWARCPTQVLKECGRMSSKACFSNAACLHLTSSLDSSVSEADIPFISFQRGLHFWTLPSPSVLWDHV